MGRRIVWFVLLVGLISVHSALGTSNKTLREVLRENEIDAEGIDISLLNKGIKSYAVLNNPEMFCVAYYLDSNSPCWGDKLNVNILKKAQNSWIQRDFDLKKLLPDRCYSIGLVRKIMTSQDYFYFVTHKNPSAGFTLVFTNELEFHGIVWGWFLTAFDDGTMVYHRSQVHFAPTHYTEIGIYNPLAKVDKKIYPLKPYRKIRAEHIKKVQDAYDKLGNDWFRNHNHHMNPELFNNHLRGDVTIDNDTRSLSFVIAYDNKDYWPEEDKLKLRGFRGLNRKLKEYEITSPIPEMFFYSLYGDLAKSRRLKREDAVLALFEQEPEVHNMLEVLLKTEKEKGRNTPEYFASLSGKWQEPQTWGKIAKIIDVPEEYTEVLHTYENIQLDEEIKYTAITVEAKD